MAQDKDNAFGLDTAAAVNDSPDSSRRKKISMFGLQGLAQYGQPSSEELQEQPLYGGDLSKASQINDEAGAPSELATERVERGPIAEETSPLLGPEERLGNTVDEVLRGEEGSYGPLSGSQRASSLRELFGPTQSGQGASSQSTAAGDADDQVADATSDSVMTGIGRARQGFSAAKSADKLSGNKGSNFLKDLFSGAGSGASFPSGLSLTGGAEATGPQFPSGLNLTGGEGAEGIPTEGLTLGADGGASASNLLGAGASGLGVLASLYSLYQARGGDLSPGQFISAIQSSGAFASQLGVLGGAQAASTTAASALPAGASAASGLAAAGAGLSGIGGVLGAGMGIGNAINAFQSGDDRALGSGIGTLVGLAGGAVVGGLVGGPFGLIIGMGIGAGAGGALGGLFGQNLPHYYAVREHAAGVGTDAVKKYMDNVVAAGETGDIRAVQRALGESFADGRVRVDLNLPKDVAAALQIPPGAGFQDLSTEQFAGLLKAYSEREGVNHGWFVGSGDVGYLSHETSSNGAGRHGPAQQLANGASQVAIGAFDTMVQYFAPAIEQTPPVAPLSWQDVGDSRLAPELEYTQYNTHTGEPGAGPPTWDPASFDQVRQAAQSGGLNQFFMAGGKPLAEDVGGGRFAPTTPFLSAAGAPNKAGLIDLYRGEQDAIAADERAMEDAIVRVQNRPHGEAVSPELMALYLRAIAGRAGYGGSAGAPGTASADGGGSGGGPSGGGW